MITRRDLAAAAIATGLTLACVSFADDAKALLDSTAWQWKDLEVKKTPQGERRNVVATQTRTLAELEMHITTLNPHTASHPPHTIQQSQTHSNIAGYGGCEEEELIPSKGWVP